ncbi:MAG: AAA family ATPase [Ignavibacteria bacterium]|nr:MAG: AAA family ATPase [Ignavibacteria bacterium]KAF0160356.1 MAG: AAA family ATPase [Ignavibacteria bacterium]
MSFYTNDEDLNRLQAEAFEHLWNGRYRLALPIAEKVFLNRPDDSDAAICLAWAQLENGNPVKAMEYANLAVEIKGDSVKARVYRAYLLSRMSIFEGAIADLDQSINNQKETLAWSYLNKARSLAGIQKYNEASQVLDLAVIIDEGQHKNWKELNTWIEKAKTISQSKNLIGEKGLKNILDEAAEALKAKEYWFSLLLSRKVLNEKQNDEAELIELESMLHLFQIRPALKKADLLQSKFKKNERFVSIYSNLKKFSELEKESDDSFSKKSTKLKEKLTRSIVSEPQNFRFDSIFFPNDFIDVFSLKLFDTEIEDRTGNRNYNKQFDGNSLKFGAEIIFNNPFYKKEDKRLDGFAVWYLNDFETFRNNFQLNVKKEWDSVIYVQLWEKNQPAKYGQGKVEIYISSFKVVEKYFVISNAIIEELPERKQEKDSHSLTKTNEKTSEKVREPRKIRPLNELLDELNSFTGLSNIKEAVKNFVSYLEFLKERKKLGLKSEDNISINAVFLGNPGTGKTTIARMLGDIFYAMGILQNGHVVEVDRAALVGEFVGQTAQKTDKIINEALGGVLLIDEAYTLVKKGAANDFGQESIEILLKRMEDRKGEFVVVAAGYTDEMNLFMNSNPGLKSRFTHTFVFEDYTPDELLQIFEAIIKKEDYLLTVAAKEILKKEFMSLYRARDKSFGNARLIRKLFENAKLNLSKICVELAEEKRTKEAMTTFTDVVINMSFAKSSRKEVCIPINEEHLKEALDELHSLVGLVTLKKEVDDMVKLARLFNEQGEDISKVFSEHLLFLGNPGTGKTTVARILGKIYSSLGILSKGHLVETDRQGLVAGFVGQTAEKTKSMIDRAIGGMLFIDEAYALVKQGDSGSDFGKEAIDILLKRMEDDRGKFIVITAGYTDEMQRFVASNPGMQSRFSKSYTFEDYTPNELIEIVRRTVAKENKRLSNQAEEKLKKYFEDVYRTRDKKFGNARIVRNILDSVKQKSLLRIADIPASERTEDKLSTIELSDINEVLIREVEARTYEVKGDPLVLQSEINELNNLIGLDNVKHEIFRLISFAKISQMKKEKGLQSLERNLHSIFIGNPGTGKRTVARLMSKIFRELGVLQKGQIIEVDRTDFVASYQEQSSIKTEKLLQQSIGGTLYIRDSNSLFRDDDPFGSEAIDTIIKRMEDSKGKFVLVLSGTPNDMKKMIDTHPGIVSYFPNIFSFEDYEPRQLLAIAANIAEKNGYTLDEGALQELLDRFDKLYYARTENFQNGITAKNILYSAITNQEERIYSIYEKAEVDLKTIILEDVEKITIE